VVVWGVTDGSVGTVVQVKALAQALGHTPAMKAVTVRKPFVWLPNAAYSRVLKFLVPYIIHSYDGIAAPWPDTIISCGRRGALAALAIKMRAARDKKTLRLLHIHDPQMRAENFDVIVAMQHDKIVAPNVIKSKFALHSITSVALQEAGQKFAKRFSAYAKPYVAVLIGGSTNKYKLTLPRMQQVIAMLTRLQGAVPGSLLITASRRTGHDNLQSLIAAFPRMRESKVYIYDGIGDNPYLGMLALADHIVVTNDSVNMMSEAMATGKPVYILRLPGHQNSKPARFAEMLIAEGVARPLEGPLETWNYSAQDQLKKLADDIKPLLAA